MARGQGNTNGGLCHCGCGQPAPIAKWGNTRGGYRKGEPCRFIRTHARRKSGVDYIVEDRGYDTPCWTWQLAKCRGYGSTGGTPVHIINYERKYGPVPEGLELDHLCRHRDCVNPDHLEAVTHAENSRRGASTKLTVDQVREIRRLLAEGALSQGRIANRYGVSRPTISLIHSGKNWAGV